ncbi:MAG: hypothetical protein HYS07_09000 [Chlamydiae bacterium]|nr:hypothetical protein [Chlamydiota bacterium]MBI3276985.1 hypothetical protein [Chlamydiota bacterium]
MDTHSKMKKFMIGFLGGIVILYSLVGYVDFHCPEPGRKQVRAIVPALCSVGHPHCDPSHSPIEKAIVLKNNTALEKYKRIFPSFKEAVHLFEYLRNNWKSNERSPPKIFSSYFHLFILHSSLLI